jgi:hypothetical protein
LLRSAHLITSSPHQPKEVSPVPISRKHLEAWKDEINVVGSGAIVAAGFFLGMPLLIPFVWLGYEAAYLLFVPDTAWYDRRLSRKSEAEVARRRQALRRRYLPTLLPEDQHRFEMLERMRADIQRQQAGQAQSQQEILRKLDYLLERFLMFGSKRAEYLEYLRQLHEQERGAARGRRSWWGGGEPRAMDAAALQDRLVTHYEAEIEVVQQELQAEQVAGSANVLRKNAEVLEQCRENVVRIGEILRNLDQQMDLVVNAFTLINGQIRTRPPEQMLTDVEDVVGSSQALAEALAAFAPLDQAVQRLGHP